MMTMQSWRSALGEALGTALLLAVVVGSGHMAETLAQGNTAVALLANSVATGLALWWLIVLFAPICGAHFNPIVSAAMAVRGELSWREMLVRAVAQTIGALLGVALAHAMFELPLYSVGTHARASGGIWLSEVVATCGLVLTILLGRRSAPAALPALIGAYITSAYWFTASTAFANPAVTLARAFTTTFAGLRLTDVPAFVAAQVGGAALALLLEYVFAGDATATARQGRGSG